MSLYEIFLTDLPLWLHKTGGFRFGQDIGEGTGPVDGQDVDCCGCYKWGENFDCLSLIEDSRILTDWQLSPESGWSLDPEYSSADGDTDPSTYQVTFEWKIGSGGTYRWVPISSDWHDKLGTAWKNLHVGWLEAGRQLCNGCPIDPPNYDGTPGETVVYNCPSRKSLATSDVEVTAYLKSAVLGTGSYNIWFKADPSGQPDKWRIRVTTAHYVEIDRDSDGACAMTLRDSSDSIIATANPGGGAPWWRVSVDVTNGNIFVINGIPLGISDGTISGANVCAENLGTISPQFGFETPDTFTGRLRIQEVYLYQHAEDKTGCIGTPECYDYECVWYHQDFNILDGTVDEFSNWTGTVPVVDGAVRFGSSGGTITYTGSKPSAWHTVVGFDWTGCPVDTRVTIRCGSWSANIYKGKDNTVLRRLAYTSTNYGENTGVGNPSETLSLSCGDGMVGANLIIRSMGSGGGIIDYATGGIVYETTSYPTGNISIETNGPVGLNWFQIIESEDADPYDPYCPALAFNCTVADYTWGHYLQGTTPNYLGMQTSGTWVVGPSYQAGWPTFAGAAMTSQINSAISVLFNPYTIPGSSYDDWYGAIALCFARFSRGVSFSLTFGSAVYTYYPGGTIYYNEAWASAPHATIVYGGNLKAIEAVDWFSADNITLSWYYDAASGLLHVGSVTAAVTLSSFLLTARLLGLERSTDYLGVGGIWYSKAPDARCGQPPDADLCCEYQPYPLTASFSISGIADTAVTDGADSWNGTYEFDRAADAMFITSFESGEKRADLYDAPGGSVVGYLDLIGITVGCIGPEDNPDIPPETTNWEVTLWFELQGPACPTPQAFQVTYNWEVTSPQTCPTITMTPLVYGGEYNSGEFSSCGFTGGFYDWIDITGVTASLSVA